MTKAEALEIVMTWDVHAHLQKRSDVQKKLWRIMDALEGWGDIRKAEEALDGLVQTPKVNEIREALGLPLRDAPLWAGRVRA